MTQWQHERCGTREDDDHPGGPAAPPGPPAPFPALINLTIPAGTAYGWSAAPGEAGGWGLLDPGDTRRLLQAASQHPRTRWCITVLNPDGTAAAHGRARGTHPWIPPPADSQRNRDGPDARQAAALADLLRRLNVTVTPIAKAAATTPTPKTATRPAASSAIWSGPVPRPAPPPAAAPTRTTTTSTTLCRTRTGPPTNATSPRPADATIA
jgi:hypothetical protein